MNMGSTKRSVCISEGLQVKLEQTSRWLKHSKNWVISRALEDYLDRVGYDVLAAEARRQSLLASGMVTKDEAFWRKRADAAGCK